MKAITLANLKQYLDARDRIEPGSHFFDRIVGGFVDPCVASITFGNDVLRMHICQSGLFKVGFSQAGMSRRQLDALARARSLVVKAGLFDAEQEQTKEEANG